MNEMLIKNGTVVFETDERPADLLIRDGKIAAILEPGTFFGDCESIDAAGLYVFPGTIDPHMHMGLYREIGEAFRLDTPRQAIGGVTTLINFHRGKGSYYETVQHEIERAGENSCVDFAISLGLCAKEHLTNLEGYIQTLGITSFKFYFDKQDIAHTFYDIPKEAALTLDRADFYFMLKQLHDIDERLLLCTHCEDADLFRRLEQDLRARDIDRYKLSNFCATRPDFVETVCVMDTIYQNSVVDGNLYIVHTSAKSSLDMIRRLQDLPGQVTVETCPHYLVLDEETSAGLLAKVNPPLRKRKDCEALWEGIRNGVVRTVGTDNVPAYKAKRFERGNDIWDTFVGFGGAGMILPVLLSEGYHKRAIPLHRLSQVNSVNASRVFQLPHKGRIEVGLDADLAIVDLDWEREINASLYGDSDYSVYEGMKFTGWPRYTLCRGRLLQKDGVAMDNAGWGNYIRRSL